jgi:nucleoid-associated protein YgaU|tara:strand:+ start:5613 stop:5918 length:306 start_codon:yes stop_codon:yes gene_type:complete
MALNRYSFSPQGKNSLGQNFISKSNVNYKIYNAAELGLISVNTHILEEGERLDYLAGLNYGDSSLWWIIAAASGIGYALQVPPGTILRIPNNITEVFGVIV